MASANIYLEAIEMQHDGTIILAGHTGGFDFAVVTLDKDGEELWRWQVN